MKTSLLLHIALVLLLPFAGVQAQSGSLDTTFMSQVGPNSNVNAIVIQPDGKTVFGGAFTKVNFAPANRLARADANGNLDASFAVGTGPSGGVNALALQSDGKVLVAGAFTNFNGTPCPGLVRVTSGGSLDPSFNPGTGVDGEVTFMAWLTNGQVIIQGDFTSFNGTPRLGLARLNANGQLDPTYDPGERASDVSALACQPDGKVVLSGNFTSLGGFAVTNIARLNANGSLDTNFCAVAGLNRTASADSVSVQTDGKILLSGFFTNVNGVARSRIARLNADGTLDLSFNPGTGFNLRTLNAPVRSAVQPDNKVLAWGYFSTYNGVRINPVVRLLPDGQLDESFSSPWGLAYARVVGVVAFQSDGKILAGNRTAEAPASHLRRYQTNGAVDANWMSDIGANYDVQTIIRQADGKLIVGGRFTAWNGALRCGLVRLAADGAVDATFTANVNTSADATVVVQQPDGKLLVAGDFTSINGIARTNLARLQPDGSLDLEFNSDSSLGPESYIYALAALPDGKVLVAGDFTAGPDTFKPDLLRLDSTGHLDTSFNAGLTGNVLVLKRQPDGKVLVGGGFTQILGGARTNVARLNPDGSLDAGFLPAGGLPEWVRALALQADGKILVAGESRNQPEVLRRLQPDGSLDATFAANIGSYGPYLTAVAPQRDGRIVIAGNFNLAGVSHTLGRLNPDGSPDSSFVFDTTPSVSCLLLQADTQLLIGGSFSSIDGVVRGGIARLVDDVSVQPVPGVSVAYLTAWVGNDTTIPAFAAGLPPLWYQWQLNGTNLPGQTNLQCFLPGIGTSAAGLYTLVAANIGGTATSGPVRLTVLPASARPGMLDTNFATGTGPNSALWHIAEQPDGKLLVAGTFSTFNGEPRAGFVRLHSNGAVDTNFIATGVNSGGEGYRSTVLPNGKVVVGGWFTSFNGSPRYRIARLETNGVVDESFTASIEETNGSAWVWPIVRQPDGKLLVGGLFNAVNGEPVTNLVRLEPDGAIDHSFIPGGGPNDYVSDIVVQPDGKILVGGLFGYFDGVVRGRITRLNTNGTLDTSFNPGVALNHTGDGVDAIVLQPDGKILIGGTFTTFNNVPRPNLARLNADGSLDTSFAPISPIWLATSVVYGLAVQPDGKVLVGVWPPNGQASACVARLNPDGSFDASFPLGVCSADGVWCLTRLASGQLMVGGGFPDLNGVATPFLARLHGDEALAPAPVSLVARLNGGLQLEWLSALGVNYQLQSATSLPAATWANEGLPLRGNGGLLSTNVSISTASQKFFRLHSAD